MLFSKNPYAAGMEGEEIVVPKICQDRPQVDFEAELAVVIGKKAGDVARLMHSSICWDIAAQMIRALGGRRKARAGSLTGARASTLSARWARGS